MKRYFPKFFISALALAAVCALSAGVLTADTSLSQLGAPGVARVGLESKFRSKQTIEVMNNTVSIGYETSDGFMPMAALAARSGFSVERLKGIYVTLHGKRYSDYASVKLASGELGMGAVPHAAEDGTWHICAGPFATNEAAELYAIGAGAVMHPAESGDLILNIDGSSAVMFGSRFQLAEGAGGLVNLGGSRYRGRVEFFASGAGVSAINIIPTELYLYGVVPMEMPASFMQEALKAQAVAARTYAASRSSTHTGGAYELCDTTHCQVYGGADKETGATTSAVDATRGVMAYYNNEPIEAMYFASSGGYTESSENVWGSGLPYLRAVKEQNESPTTWSRSYDFEQIDDMLEASGSHIAPTKDVAITSVNEFGRVQELTINGTYGTKTLKKEEIRTFFARSGGGSLPSRLFKLVNGYSAPSQELSAYAVAGGGAAVPVTVADSFAITSAGTLFQNANAVILGADGVTGGYRMPAAGAAIVTRDAGVITFAGSGNGHGVGMSQHGANGMAQLGYNFEQILKHYYTGVEIR